MLSPRLILKVKEARRLKICRVCRRIADCRRPDGHEGMTPFVYSYGQEYAHHSCLEELRLSEESKP